MYRGQAEVQANNADVTANHYNGEANWNPDNREDTVVRSPFAKGYDGSLFRADRLGTLYQDSVGTTPISAVEQGIGLAFDTSQGMAVGANLLTNSTFDTDLTGWTNTGSATFTWEAGRAKGTITGALSGGRYQDVTVTAGVTYKVNIDIDVTQMTIDGTSRAQLVIYDGAGFTTVLASIEYKTALGQFSPVAYVTPTTTTLRFAFFVGATAGQTTTAYFDNANVKSFAGKHLIQATGASRPTYSKRYNLLTYSEQFDNAAWTKLGFLAFGSGSTINAIAAPDGTVTAELFTESTLNEDRYVAYTYSGTSGLTYTWTCYVKPNGRTWIALNAFDTVRKAVWFDCTGAGAVGSNDAGVIAASITAVGGGWYRLSSTRTASAATFYPAIIPTTGDGAVPPYLGNGTSELYVWGAQVDYGTVAKPYQRIAAATDYDEAGFLPYIKFDAVDDSFTCATGGGSTTGFTFQAPVMLGGTAAAQDIWSDAGTNTGIKVSRNASNQIVFSVGTGSQYVTATSAAQTVGNTAIVTARFNPALASVGSERVTNGTFDTDTLWIKGTTWTISGGVASSAGVGTDQLSGAAAIPDYTVGKSYIIEFDAVVSASAIGNVYCGGTATGAVSSTGHYKRIVVATSATSSKLAFSPNAGFTGSIDNVSVKEISGNAIELQINNNTPVYAQLDAMSAGTAGFTIGKANGASSNYFGGRLYGEDHTKNYAMTDAEKSAGIQFWASRAGVTL